MKKLLIPAFLITLIFTNSCGTGDDLSSDDINNISSALTECLNDMDNPDLTEINEFVHINTGVNYEYQCTGGGHITASGNVNGSCNEEGYCTYSAMITFQVSDPTNNLNDCDVGNGILLDGTINLVITGTSTGGVIDQTSTLLGTIGINRRGDTGGLVPISDDCYINLRYVIDGNTASGGGTICGHDVSSN